MIGYKSFDENFQCRGFQYEVGETYSCAEMQLYVKGFHFQSCPLAVLEYYPKVYNQSARYAIVEALGNIQSGEYGIYVTDKIKILQEITLEQLVSHMNIPQFTDIAYYNSTVITNNCEQKAILHRGDESIAANVAKFSVADTKNIASIAASTGIRSVSIANSVSSCAVNTGNFSYAIVDQIEGIASNTAYHSYAIAKKSSSTAIVTGRCSTAISEGIISAAIANAPDSTAIVKNNNSVALAIRCDSTACAEIEDSVAIAFGDGSCVKGKLGAWLVLVDYSQGHIRDIKSVKVDGIHIKPDTYYYLTDGKLEEASIPTDIQSVSVPNITDL